MEIAKLQGKRRGELAVAQRAVLDSSDSTADRETRQHLDYVEAEIMELLQQTRDMLSGLKRSLSRSSASDRNTTRAQVDLAGKNLVTETRELHRSQATFDQRLREQVQRQYQIANPGATTDEIDAGVESVLSGQAQTFQVSSPVFFSNPCSAVKY